MSSAWIDASERVRRVDAVEQGSSLAKSDLGSSAVAGAQMAARA
jgi:hypothetical protein